MTVQEPTALASTANQIPSNIIADQSKQKKLAGRQVTQNDNTQNLLPPELNALISSEIQEITGQAGGLLNAIPQTLKVRVQSEAEMQTTLKIRNQDITTAMLQAIGRDFPHLLNLNVEGSTLNGSVHFKAADILQLLPSRPFLTITGVPTLERRAEHIQQHVEANIAMKQQLILMRSVLRMDSNHESTEVGPLSQEHPAPIDLDRHIDTYQAQLERLVLQSIELFLEARCEMLKNLARSIQGY